MWYVWNIQPTKTMSLVLPRNTLTWTKYLPMRPGSYSQHLKNLAVLGRSDHDTLSVPHIQCVIAKRNNKLIRHLTRSSGENIAMCNVNWESDLSMENPYSKAEKLQSTISDILNKHCPLKSKPSKKPKTPWVDVLARKLYNAKTKASKRGDITAMKIVLRATGKPFEKV